MKVRFSPRAISDLAEISDYIRSHNPLAAQRVRAAILNATEILSHFPDAGRSQATENVRKLVIARYPYLIYYVHAADDEVVIVAIQHAAREREFDDL